MKNRISIVKIGGNVLDDKKELGLFIKQFNHIPGKKILIHGGGKRATEVSHALGVTPVMVDGRRITDQRSLEVVTMVYGGLINRNLVALLQSIGINALGLTGADLNIIPATKRKHPTIDFGFVGDFHIHEINADRILWLTDAEITPVFCAITHDGAGNLLNTNADTLAAGIATALVPKANVSLYYCFEKKGVLLDLNTDVAIPELTFDAYQDLREKEIINKGMIPKLDNAFNALHAGVSQVIIGNVANLLTQEGTKLIEV
jgi:acetylglutamate kinase